ncbi:MAG: hypothetical protein CMH48_06265 [Muricauda sp.]|nr:hypothetical protein [Allomuricauda sp.]|tara:strand:+ start:23599 stop:24714 length:1116 start_codon:yes stop_codon:yes gene_type:complete
MNLKRLFWAVLALGAISCSTDDADNPKEEVKVTAKADFVVIGEDLDRVFQYSYEGAVDNGQLVDLTDQLGVLPSYLTLRQVNELLSFYSFGGGAFSLAQIDLATGARANFDDFYANGPGRSVVWGANNLSNVFFAYLGPSGTRNLAIQSVNLQDFSTEDLTVDFDIDTAFQPLFFGERIFITYRDGRGDYKLTAYDTESKTLGTYLNFGDVPISILIDDMGDLVVVKNGVDASIEVYDINTMSLVRSAQLDFNSGFSPGPVEGAVLSGDRLYYALPFVQPARYPAGPAIFDFVTQENFVADLTGIATEIEQELKTTVLITAQSYDPQQEVFLVGYGTTSDEVLGGVMQIAIDGQLVANITFPFFPTYFVKN